MRKLMKHCFGLFGILCLIIAVFMISGQIKSEKRCIEETTGVIADFNVSYDAEDNSPSYFPVVQYNAGHKHIEVASSFGSGKPKYAIGDEVLVRYNPDDPEDFILAGDKTSLKFGIYLLVVGIALQVIEFLSMRGILKDNTVTKRHVRHRSSGSGVSIDLGDITGAVGVFKALKDNFGGLKDMSSEERQAYFEAMQENPEAFIPTKVEEETTDER